MNGLKALVIFLGALIVLGFVVLIYGIMTKAGKLGEPKGGPAELSLVVPKGSTLESFQADGDRLYIHLNGPGGDRILILDNNGKELSTVKLEGTEE